MYSILVVAEFEGPEGEEEMVLERGDIRGATNYSRQESRNVAD
jgi:hypothetical protein